MTLLVLVPLPGTRAAKVIAAGSAILARATDVGPPTLPVYFEGNVYGHENLREFRERVLVAAGRLVHRYPTIARGTFDACEFVQIGTFTCAEDFSTTDLLIRDDRLLEVWCRITPAIFKQTVPCASCPFRKEGGARHSPEMMASYVHHFIDTPGATFPCHKSVPASDDRTTWSNWQEGQVLCAGGLLMAAKLGQTNGVIALAVANGWYNPASHAPEALATVFDTEAEMVAAATDDGD